jgi:hypothetical protein
MVSFKNSIWCIYISKNAEFHADFESVEKVLKKFTKIVVISKNGAFFTTFSTDSKSACNSAFLISFLIKKKFWPYLHF